MDPREFAHQGRCCAACVARIIQELQKGQRAKRSASARDGVTAGRDSEKPPVRKRQETETKYEGQLSTSWALAAQPLHRCRFFINQCGFFPSSRHIDQRDCSFVRRARRHRHYVGKEHPPSTPLRLIALCVYTLQSGGRLAASSNSEKDLAILV